MGAFNSAHIFGTLVPVEAPSPAGCLQTYGVQQNPTSFDNLVGAGKQHRWHGKSERFGGLQVDDQLEFGGLLHWKIGRLSTFQHLVDVAGRAPIRVSDICPVQQESAGHHKFSNSMKRRPLVD